MPNYPFIHVFMNRQLQFLKKLSVLFSVSLLLCFTSIKAQTLNPGDLAVIGLNALTDEVHLVTLVDIPAGTVMKITDRGWDGSTDAFQATHLTGDGTVTWTLANAVPAGTVLELFFDLADSGITLTNLTASANLTPNITVTTYTTSDAMLANGDQIFIYQGSDDNPFFIFGMNNSAGPVDATNWNNNYEVPVTFIGLRDSYLPDGTDSQNALTNGVNAIGLWGGSSQLGNVQYTGPIETADRDTWLARITNIANWDGSDLDNITNPITSAPNPIVDIAPPNNAPTDIALSNASVNQSAGANVVVGTLSSTDADGSDTHTYSLVAGTGDDNNGDFNISGASLRATNPSILSAGANSVRIQTSDNNGGTYEEAFTITVVDDVAPTINISSDKTSLKAGETATLTFTLSEGSTNFALVDVTAAGGTLSGFSGSGITYTAILTPTANTTATASIDIAAATFTDAAGNNNTAATQLTIAVDTQLPTVSISSDNNSLKAGETATLTFTLSEVSTDFAAGDITVTGGILSDFLGSGTSYSVTFAPSVNTTVTATIDVNASTFTDAAGNGNAAATQLTVAVDTEAPTVGISSDKASLKADETATLTFTLSEVSANFEEDDVTVTGGILSGFSGTGTSYSATFTPSTNVTLTATIDVAAGAFTDAAGNGNTAAPQLTLAIDTEAPSGYAVSVDQASITLANHTSLSFTLSGAEVGADFDYTITSGGGGTPVTGNGTITSTSQQVSGIDVSSLPNGTLTLSVILTDAPGNAGDPATDNVTKAVNYPPVLTASGGTVTFTEPEEGSPVLVAIDGGLTVSDVDNGTLTSATVAITVNFQADEDELAFDNDGATMGNISGSYDAGTGILSLASAGAIATLAEWQAALRSVVYSNSSQDPNTTSRTASFMVDDGMDDSAPATKAIDVVAVNTPPAAVDDEVAVTEGIPATGNTLTNDSDVEGDALTASLVTAPVNGTIVLNADGSFTYTPNAGYNGRDSLTYQVCDNGAPSLCDTALAYFNVEAINNAPSITAPATIAVDEDVITPLTGISFADVDAGSGDVTATFSVPSGTLSATSGGGTTVSGSGTASLTLVGTITDLNAFIAASGLNFATALNATSNVTLTVSIDDGGHTGTDPGNSGTGSSEVDATTITLIITAVNDAPVNTVPANQEVDQDGALVFSTGNGNIISISDVDAGGGTIGVTLTATNGLITLGSTTGLTFISGSGAGDGTMTFEGSIADINTALNGLTFVPASGYNGAAGLQIITDDLGLTGSGGSQTDTDAIVITVNAINPKVTGVNATSLDGTYKIADAIMLTVSFDQAVMVDVSGGLPTLLLETGSVDREATYVSGSGSNTLTFNYTVQAGDLSADLDYASTAALALSGAAIKNASGDDAVLTLPAVGGANSIAGQHSIAVDGVAPAVTLVAVPADGYYLEDDVLTFTVQLDEDVIVNTGTGIPYLELTIGVTEVQVSYISGSGTNSLTFSYTVQPGEQDLDGVVLGSNILLNGGTVQDAAGNDVVPALNNAAPTHGVFVYAITPGVTLSTTAVSPISQAFTVSMVFTEPVTGFTVGDITATNATISNLQTADNVTYTVLVTPVADGTVSLEVPADVAMNIGNNGNTVSNTLTVTYDGTPPAAPSDLTADAGEAQVELSWAANAEADVVSYRVYGGIAGSPPALLETMASPQTEFIHTGLTNGIAYGYQISAVDATGNESPLTAIVNAIPMADQAITFDALIAMTYGDDPITLAATASSGLPISYTSSDPAIASVADNVLTIHASGTVTITARQEGDEAFHAADPVSQMLAVSKATLTVAAEAKTKVHGADDPALTYTYDGLVGSDSEAVFTGALVREPGEEVATYAIAQGTLAAGDNYAIAFTAADFIITWSAITGVTLEDGSFVYDGTAKSLAITGALPDGTAVTYVNNSRTNVGTQKVMATISGDNYEDLVLTADLTIIPGVVTGVTLADASYSYDGTAKSLAITGALPDGTAVTYTNNSRTDAGTQKVTATINGDNYEDLALMADLTITPATRSIAFAAIPAKTYGDADFDAGAITSTDEEVSYTSSDAAVAEIVDGQVHIAGAGTATITATVPQNGNYSNRPEATQVLTVSKATQAITFNAPMEASRDAGSIPLDATASSGLPIVLTLDDPEVATLSGLTLSILRLGTVRITAMQEGDANYEPAEPVTVAVRVIDPASDMPIRIHKAVSPNGDGINEYLVIEAIKDYPENRVTVFNRNGTIVYEASGYNNGTMSFRGIGAGQLRVAAGTYFYVAEIKVDGEWKYEKGWFVLRY